jgi:predicted DNA-binding transcriptional regulator AlpA
MVPKKPKYAGERLSYRINELPGLTGLSRSTLYKYMKPGADGTPPRLRWVPMGSFRLVPAEAIDELLGGTIDQPR